MTQLIRRFVFAALALGLAAVLPALPASAQGALTGGPPYPGGVCTCSQMTPPSAAELAEQGLVRRFDCASAMKEMRDSAGVQKGQMRKQCMAQTTERCEAQNGPDVCAAMAIDIATNCSQAVEQAFQRDFVPLLNQRSGECDAANRESVKQAQAPWVEWCETVERPSACSACDTMRSEIIQLEAEIATHEAEIASLRAKPVFSDAEQATINQRLSDVQFLSNQLKNKKQNFDLFEESGYCS